MRKLIIDARIRSFADDYKTKLQNQCPEVVSDLRALSNFVSSNNTFKDATVVKDYIDAIIGEDNTTIATIQLMNGKTGSFDLYYGDTKVKHVVVQPL